MLRTPQFEEPAVTERQVGRAIHSKPRRSPVDPFRRSFQLRVISDRCLIDYAMAFAVGPLAAPLFVPESSHQPDRQKHLRQHVAVGNFGFRLDSMLVRIFARPHVRQALVRHRPLARIVPNAQNLGPRAHRPVRRVIENIALERPRRLLAKTRLTQSLGEFANICNAKFDLGFDRHVSSEYTQLAVKASNGDNKYVKTLRLSVDPARMETDEARAAIAQAAQILRSGGLVALPTETVYGLGANALDPAAVAHIFEAKQRPSWDPIIVHIAGPVNQNAMLEPLVAQVSPIVLELMQAFWPGPLTLLLPRSVAVPDIVTAGRPLVGIRMPAHPVAFEIIRQAGVPVAAPSANIFSHISPTTAAHVLDDLDGKIDAIIDAGPTRHGVESTVLDPTQSPMMIYRPGAITAQQIREIAGPVINYEEKMLPQTAARESIPSPGVGLRHYAPRARLILVESTLAELLARLARAAIPLQGDGRLGLMLPAELASAILAPPLKDATVFPWGHWGAPDELAEKLYAGLRALDAEGCTVILCPLPDAAGVGEAIRDRLRKAAHSAKD